MRSLVGCYEGHELTYVAKMRNGFTPALRESVFKQVLGLEPSDACSRIAGVSPESVGRGIDGRPDGEVPLAETTAGRGD
jgi:hypothetical protein